MARSSIESARRGQASPTNAGRALRGAQSGRGNDQNVKPGCTRAPDSGSSSGSSGDSAR